MKKHIPLPWVRSPHDMVSIEWEVDGSSGSTASGYGDYLPTRWEVLVGNRWRRVRCICHSNVGTLYIGRRRAEKLQCVEIMEL